MKLHTFGCSITQGFALPDVVQPIRDAEGRVLTQEEIEELEDFHWEDIHLYKASELAWPKRLADRLGLDVINHARRGSCFQQIARQVALEARHIQPGDTAIVMWTYLSRLSLQWPSRTSVPFCNIADPKLSWRTVILGFNTWFGLERFKKTQPIEDERIHEYIYNSTRTTYLDPLGVFNRYYNNLVLQQITADALERRGARVIHLSVETESVLEQLEQSRSSLDPTLREYTGIPNPSDWYRLDVDYECTPILLDPKIPLAENDMHPSVEHHEQFAEWLHDKYFKEHT